MSCTLPLSVIIFRLTMMQLPHDQSDEPPAPKGQDAGRRIPRQPPGPNTVACAPVWAMRPTSSRYEPWEKQVEEDDGDKTKLERARNPLLSISTRVPPESSETYLFDAPPVNRFLRRTPCTTKGYETDIITSSSFTTTGSRLRSTHRNFGVSRKPFTRPGITVPGVVPWTSCLMDLDATAPSSPMSPSKVRLGSGLWKMLFGKFKSGP